MATQEEILDVIKAHPEGIRQSEVASKFNLPMKALNKQIFKLALRGEITRQLLCEHGRPYMIYPLKHHI